MLKFLRRLFARQPSQRSLGEAASGIVPAGPVLRQNEEHFAQFVADVRDYAIFLLDRQGNVITWNAGAERIKGYRSEGIIGQHFSRFYPQESIASGLPDHELSVAAAKGRYEDEGWRLRKDGSKFWANVVITALRNDDGTLRGFAKITRDLTDRRKAEETARHLLREAAGREAAEAAAKEIDRQREQLQVTLSSIGDAVIVTDENGDVTFLNPVAGRLTGWELDEAKGQSLERVCPIINEVTRRPIENPVQTVFRMNAVVEIANHTTLLAKDGREIPIEDSAAPIRGREGVVSGAVLVFRDVTESRKAFEAHERLAAIVESCDDAIIGLGLDAQITSWNKGAERLYGFTAAEIVGQPLSVLIRPDHPDDVPEMMKRIEQGESIEHFETIRMRKDGRRVDVSLTISPIRDSDGKVIGISKIAHDIGARKEEDRRKSEFIALLAHELRNPLAPLRNGLEVMRLTRDERQLEEARAVMERQLEHLVRLVDDLLDVSRISRGKLELRKETIDLTSVMHQALEACGQLIEKNGDSLTVKFPEEPAYVDADRTRLVQTFCNLLRNAVKYSERGSSIWLTVSREGGDAIISVKDNGVGIPRSMLNKIFDLFTQVDRTLEKSQGGLGVGLAIAKQLIEMHGESIEARSEGHGKGSEFIVRLPIATRRTQLPRKNPTLLPRAARCKILVADDNADAATSLAAMLTLAGHEVHTAHDGQEAIDKAALLRPGVILLDIGMPKLNGYDTCGRIREQSWGKNIRIIAITGWGQDEDKRRAEEAGFDAHIVKPVGFAALDKLLAKSRITRHE